MMLYLCRHAIAEEAGAGQADEARALTPEGVKKFRQTARGIVRIIGAGEITLILTSPLTRARQTAEIVSAAVKMGKGMAEVRVTRALAPPGDLVKLLKEARAGQVASSVMAVGHEPTLSEWIGKICFAAVGEVCMKKGAVAAIELGDSGERGELRWLMQPGMLRSL